MKIFITGSEGFIGSHLTEKLVAEGFKVKALAMYNFKNSIGWLETIDKKIFKEIEIVKGDIRDIDFLNNQLKKIDTVIHLAALIGIPYSYVSSRSYLETNVSGTLNILQAALKNGTNKIINTSTSEVYGSAIKVPISEKHLLQGQSPYSATKIAADQIAFSFFKSFNLPVVTLRPFNTYGPRQSMRAVIPTIINQILNNNILEIGNLNSTRDFNYVDDICDGFLRTLKTKNKNIFGETINLGTGYEISIKKIIDLISSILEKKIKINVSQKRIRPKNSEVMRLCADSRKAKKLIKWNPKYSGKDGLIRGLEETINWYRINEISENNVTEYFT